MSLPSELPPEAVAFLQEIGYMDADRLRVGDRAPLLTLTALQSGEPVPLGAPEASLPTVLIFGSYT